MVELCVLCKKNPVKEGFKLCEKCYGFNESDANRNNKAHFSCPICHSDIGSRIICPKCGVVRTYLMSAPFHCEECHCQYSYRIGSELLCWCCNAPFNGSSIDSYINYAIHHFEDFKKWSKQ
jgi:hypothetical protein